MMIISANIPHLQLFAFSTKLCKSQIFTLFNGVINRVTVPRQDVNVCDSQFPVVGMGSGPGKPPTGSWVLPCVQTVR